MYIPNWNITNSARIDYHATCRSLLDHVTPSSYWAALRNQVDFGFLDAFNINSAQHICMASEWRLCYEHEIMTREKFERKFSDSAVIVQHRDAEVANLNTQNAGLLENVSALELVRGELDGKVSQLDAAERRFAEQATKLDAHIADVRRDMDNDLYAHMLIDIAGRRFRLTVHQCDHSVEFHSALEKVISMAINKGIQQGLEAGIAHGKAGRSFTQIEAYDLKKGLKDSPLALIMSALTLKDDHGDANITPEPWDVVIKCHPAIRGPVVRRGLCPPPSSKLGGASSSVPPHDSSLGVADYQVSTLVLSGDGGSTTQPLVVQAHNDLFDTHDLDGAGGT
nr:hypothetical protein [Tanacetum cinerariifolium]